ncbi:MAG: cytochrome c peroxidase, partial [Bacteroidota bacterium]
PVQNHLEMGMELLEVLPGKLQSLPYYPALFDAAFGSQDITEERIRFALAQYLRSMNSLDSKYDREAKTGFANFTPLEKMGFELVTRWNSKAKCASCHGGILFDGWTTHNIGLEQEGGDQGAGEGRFKVPSLRNIAVTAPYMHDGRFQTLEDLVEHYNQGIQPNQNLSWDLRNDDNSPLRLNLDEVEKRAIIAFLNTLTDEQYLTDPKFSDPFK